MTLVRWSNGVEENVSIGETSDGHLVVETSSKTSSFASPSAADVFASWMESVGRDVRRGIVVDASARTDWEGAMAHRPAAHRPVSDEVHTPTQRAHDFARLNPGVRS